jgi:hypothetical protein
MIYQLGWTTLPGLRGLSVSDFRATPTVAPDNEKGVAVAFTSEAERDSFLRELESDFAPRRFNNAADAFDTVKAWIQEHACRKAGGDPIAITGRKTVRILNRGEESLSQSKDEEYAYWQSRPPLERLVAMQELSFAFFEERDNAAEVRRQFLRSPVSLPRR